MGILTTFNTAGPEEGDRDNAQWEISSHNSPLERELLDKITTDMLACGLRRLNEGTPIEVVGGKRWICTFRGPTNMDKLEIRGKSGIVQIHRRHRHERERGNRILDAIGSGKGRNPFSKASH